jgi:hypothetical protein
MAPLYSFDPDTSGPGGGPGSMVMSIACAEWRCGECAEWFRCDHACHRRQSPYRSEVMQDEATRCWFFPDADEMAPEGP